MKKLLILIVLCFATVVTYGQTKKAYLRAAQEAESEENYYAALTYYQEVLDFNYDDPAIIYKVAESARKFAAYDIAADHYQQMIDSTVVDSLYPLSSYYLAEMKQRLGAYDEALIYYNLYVAEHGGTSSKFEKQARKSIEDVNWAISRMDNPDRSAEITQLENSINTSFSEFGATLVDSTLYYTSMQHEEKNTKNIPKRSISKLHKTAGDSTIVLTDSINDTDLLVAHTSYNRDLSEVFFTICEYGNADSIRCDIYMSAVDVNGSFGPEVKLSNAVNIDSFTNTQPHLAFDKQRQQEILYFVSDRPGGEGKLDIYFSVRNEQGDFSEARNLAELNTEEDDLTPYYNSELDKLYFSSDGRQGLGGYDIYSSQKSADTWGDPTSLRPPVNSSYHDLYYTVDDAEDEAHFSSNREGATFVDETLKACCFDIYNVIYDEVIIDLDAITYDDFTKMPLFEATVHLIDAQTGDTINSVYAETDSSHVFQLKKDNEYTIVAVREHYNTSTIPLSTVDITKSTELIERIFMTTDKMQVDIFTFNDRTKEALENVQITITDTEDESVVYLNTNESGNDNHVYLPLGKKYKVEAKKFGFVTTYEAIDLSEVTEPGLMRKDIFLEVFDIEDYMPVTVFFENNEPRKKRNSSYSDAIYGELYADYIRVKPNYLDRVAKKFSPDIKAEARRDLLEFFEGDVAGGYEKMKRFMRALKKELGLGRSLDIAIKGYTSPLDDTKYNLLLGQRRVWSVKNELLAYENGLFIPYIESGQLILTDISFGEETAPSNVSDNPQDINSSIYSVGASRERRVQIVSIKDQ